MTFSADAGAGADVDVDADILREDVDGIPGGAANVENECDLRMPARPISRKPFNIGRQVRLEGSDSDNNQWTASCMHAAGARACSPLIRAGPQCRRTKERPLFYGSARPFYVLQLASLQSLPSIFELSDMCQKNTKIVNVWFILLRLAPKHETQLNCN